MPKTFFKIRDKIIAPFHQIIPSFGISVGFLLTIILTNVLSAFYIINEFRDPTKLGAAKHGYMAGTFLEITYITTNKNSLTILMTGMSVES